MIQTCFGKRFQASFGLHCFGQRNQTYTFQFLVRSLFFLARKDPSRQNGLPGPKSPKGPLGPSGTRGPRTKKERTRIWKGQVSFLLASGCVLAESRLKLHEEGSRKLPFARWRSTRAVRPGSYGNRREDSTKTILSCGPSLLFTFSLILLIFTPPQVNISRNWPWRQPSRPRAFTK